MSRDLNLLAFAGSLRAQSTNLNALRCIQRLAPEGVEIDLYELIDQLPHFNPDLDQDAPPAIVTKLRQRVGAADGLLVACPEYAHGIPGSFKNCLDWLVASQEFPGKPVALINTSPGSFHAQSALREVLSTTSAQLIAEGFISLPIKGRSSDVESILLNEDLRTLLNTGLEKFCRIIRQRKSSAE